MLKLEDLTLRLHPADNVVVVKRPLKPGVELESGSLRLALAKGIPPGHKLAVAEIADGAPVTKYGQTIGFAKGRIAPGEHVHTHNVGLRDFGRDYAFGVDARPVAYHPASAMRQFQGFSRPGGKAGTRNYIGIISSVNCSAGVSRYVADRFRGPDFARDFPGIDGVVPFTHKIGCGIQPGAPHELLQRVTAGIARHPNIAGYVMIGLGCEVNQVHLVAEAHKLQQPLAGEQPPTFLTIQTS
ncbi:MAG: UxaA family hydrolase, partial [Verrucomicrobia bacterium]|nr:UxaA family hydrolase [Verrucomicrobiota bacterium]